MMRTGRFSDENRDPFEARSNLPLPSKGYKLGPSGVLCAPASLKPVPAKASSTRAPASGVLCAPASLKRRSLDAGKAPGVGPSGVLCAPASLKHAGEASTPPPSNAPSGVLCAPASLKLDSIHTFLNLPKAFRGTLCPGLIEASTLPDRGPDMGAFRGTLCPGLIEAGRQASESSADVWSFRGTLCPGLIEAARETRRAYFSTDLPGYFVPRPH